MRRQENQLTIIAVATSFVFLSGCAAQPEGTAVTEADGERVVCRKDREIGSNLGTRRVCKTISEWESERELQQEGMRGVDRTGVEVDQSQGGSPTG